MRKILLTVASALLLMPAALRADEGMWLLPLLEKMNSDALRNLGSRLTPEQIYSVNNSSIKDAIVQFGGGCTGEIISGDGLLVTNHHCGYGNIQSLSTTEHNYLEDGFFAMSRAEEIPCPGLTVRFLQSMTDVTDQIAAGADRRELIAAAEKANPNCQVRISSFYNDNVYYLIVSKVYRDVRFVGAPPASSGKFGGDTDNWMWPRHTCDFSMFRVYAGADNEPADYSPDNRPMHPRQFLNISLKGVQEGDFAMIMGYPGSTQRYQTAAQLADMIETNDVRIAARGVRQDVLWKAMRSDDKVGLQYASKYSGSSNGWKKWIGEKEAFAALDIIPREEQKERDLTAWINADPARKAAYGGAIDRIAENVGKTANARHAAALLTETLGRIEVLSFAATMNRSLQMVQNAKQNEQQGGRPGMNIPADSPEQAIEMVKGMLARQYKDYNADVDRDVAVAVINHYKANVNPADAVKIKGKSILMMDTKNLVDDLFRKSIFTSEEKLNARPVTLKTLAADPAVQFAEAVTEASTPLSAAATEGRQDLAAATKAYGAALLKWNEGKPLYPDANSTCRLTYGTVKSYEPKDGVLYKHYTTLKGVMEKEDPDNYEFRVPAKLKEIYQNKDYGQYADKNGEVVACFLTNLDITGGNSGSPVLDADGSLIGLAFDGNWEAMSGDVLFDPDLQRCICVDIRYVLLMVDKFAGAGYLLNEMNLIRE
ncbi:MAG: S46 family peptidase [Bacteroidales bacterium]|nr:S46 family peptidase [Bacteroidales bacterium]